MRIRSLKVCEKVRESTVLRCLSFFESSSEALILNLGPVYLLWFGDLRIEFGKLHTKLLGTRSWEGTPASLKGLGHPGKDKNHCSSYIQF